MSTVTGVDVDRSVEPGGGWLAPAQDRIDRLAQGLLADSDVEAARAEALVRFESAPECRTPDGARTVSSAVDNLLFSCMQMAVNNDPTRPGLRWTARLPYTVGEHSIHDSHYGADSPDRMYRMIAVSSEYR